MKKATIGLFGFGVVGEGIYRVLSQKPQLQANVKKVVIKHPDKKREAPQRLFTVDAKEILDDPEIDLVVELIDDAHAALEIALAAMNNQKSVISANKKMIAENHELLIETARQNNVSFLYEAAVCGSIPVIRNLEEYFDNDLINSICGIINGSTNYILTQMHKKGNSFAEALSSAQEKGFAESDPSLDVGGWDARDKLKILALHAYGKKLRDEDIYVKGIQSINTFDIAFAKQKNYVTKLIATCKLGSDGQVLEASVIPTFLPPYHALRLTNNEFNAVLIGGELSDEQFFYGKGAGRYPTSSAVLSDISAYKYNYRYAYKKKIEQVAQSNIQEHKFYIRSNSEINIDKGVHVLESYSSEAAAYLIVECSYEELALLERKNGALSIVKLL